MTDAVGRGGHDLPPHVLGLTAPPSHRPKRRRTGLIAGILAGVVAIATLGAVQAGAGLAYDDAESAFREAARSATAAATVVEDADADLKSSTEFAGLILSSDSGTLVDSTTRDPLATALADADESAASAEALLAHEIPAVGEKPTWFWELFPASSRLEEEREEVTRLERELEDALPALEDSTRNVTEQGIALLSAAATAAGGFEAAHLSARNDDVIALRDAAAAVASTTVLDQTSVDAFVALQDAATQVVASEQAELAEKAGPLQQVRLEIEAFARSLAPGVLLEFDWNPIVNGAGGSGSMGGLTTWWWDEPDRALIELSNSVAEQWPSIRSKSLVAHEVGHAISVKCEDLYDSSTQDSIEQWATAWAISMGFTDDANGVWAYGYPPQSYIDAAHGCR